jgi:hypothetical protein
VPLDGVVSGLWRDAVIETDAQGRQRINRITYEICVLQALRVQLRCKEIWVVGANEVHARDQRQDQADVAGVALCRPLDHARIFRPQVPQHVASIST